MKTGAFRASVNLLRVRVKAGVLQLTLGIGMVISIICASMILIAYFSRLVFLQQNTEDELRAHATSGIQYGMANRSTLIFNELREVDLYGEEIDSVDIIRKPWGLFEVIAARARRGDHRFQKTALIAAQPDEIGKSALYVPDNNAPIYLVGKASITGTAYLSDRKLSTGYIDGKGYNGKTLITGDVKKSESTIPLVDTVLLHELRGVFKNKENSYHINRLDFLPIRKNLSFHSAETNYYFSNQSIDLSDSLAGNLIVHSAIKVRVTSNAVLTDIIIMAPDIDIDHDFKGSIQCFATRSIIVGRASRLEYPSALVLAGQEQDSTIIIREDARVDGVVVIPGYDQSMGSKGIFRIEKNAVLHGASYVNGTTDIQGSVWGHVMTRWITTKISTTEYSNHLMDAEVNGTKRSPYLPASLLWGHTKELVIGKWLK